MLANERGGVYVDRINTGGPAARRALAPPRADRERPVVESVDCFHEEHVWDAYWLIYLGVRFAEIGTTRSVGDR